MGTLVNGFWAFSIGLLLLAGEVRAAELAFDEFWPKLSTDFGHIVKGQYFTSDVERYPLNRSTVILEQDATYGSEWELDAGFRVTIWWPFQLNAVAPVGRNLRGAASLSRVRAKYNFSESSFLEFGFFPYKYNPDAKNLGEYLYRSGTYPGIIRNTDGMYLMNSALYEAYGVHARIKQWDGLLVHDFNIFSELTYVPVGELTPAYEISLNQAGFQFGLGAAFNRLISYDSEGDRPNVPANGFYQFDTGGTGPFRVPYGVAASNPKLQSGITGDSAWVIPLHYYTQRGIKLMARVALDFGVMMGSETIKPGDFKLYSEIALLGWENQPFFYEDRLNRMPVMLGVSLPVGAIPHFKPLDALALEAEYYAARFSENTEFETNAIPVWTVRKNYSPSKYTRDDWKWSVHASKSINRLLTVHFQAANDHLRLLDFTGNPGTTTLMQTPKHWYYLIRLECGL